MNTKKMSYSVHQLALLAGVTVRTLHHYDEISLLKPARIRGNGYRHYEEKELLKLQQILFFRELDFPLPEIAEIISSPTFDMKQALNDQKNLIELKKKRLTNLIKTIDKTINSLNKKTMIKDDELYDAFNDKEQQQYADEVKERWGNTDAYKQSQERVKKMTKAQMAKLKEDADIFMKKFAATMQKGKSHTSSEIQEMIDQHYNALRTFYEPNLKIYRGLAEMYVADPRFTAYYEKYAIGLAVFMKDAMIYYVDTKEASL